MSQKKGLQIRSLSRDLISYLRLYGIIDETLDTDELLSAASGRDIILNLKAITRISSFGVREWVHAIAALAQKAERITLVECSPVVVSQLNMVANFAGTANVVSVQVPYFCEACSWDTEVTRELDRDLRTELESLPPVMCKRCKAVMTFDDDAEQYFAFLQTVHGQGVDPALAAFMRDFAAAMDTPLPEETAPRSSQPARATAAKGGATKTATPGAANAVTARARRAGDALGRFATQLVAGWKAMSYLQRGAIGGLSLLVLFLVGALVLLRQSPTQPGAAPEDLVAFQDNIKAERLDAAAAVLDRLERSQLLTRELASRFHDDLANARNRVAQREAQKAVQEYQAARYDTAVEAANRAAAVAPLDADTEFALAESLRHLERMPEAMPHYRNLVEHFPEHPRVDDALFWQAEYMAENQPTAALDLYKRLVKDFPKSNFRRSAKKRMEALAKKSGLSRR